MKLLNKNLYSAKKLDENRWEVILSDEDHPIFKAHFEGNPLLPAFIQIDIFTALIEKKITKIERCKFKQPILPNDLIVYEIITKVDHIYKVKIVKNNEVASEIKIVCTGA